MAKITTTYDSTLKEKVFIIKGEEAYARTTDCVLTELFTNNGERRTDWNSSLDNMKLELRIDVLRDVGASQVVLYDNDITLGVFDLDTNSHQIDLKYESGTEDNRIELAYDIEHNIYAKYMGNKQCLKSQSQSYKVFEPMPDKFKCELEFFDEYGGELPLEYDQVREIPVMVKLSSDEEDVSGETIKIYDNDELIVEYQTDSSGEILFPIGGSTLIPQGLHKLTAVFEGTQYLESKTTRVDISVGYKVTVEECPYYVVNGEPINIVAKVESYLGNPPFPTSIADGHFVVRGATDSPIEIPNENGYLYFNDVVLNRQYFSVGLEVVYDADYVSEEQNVMFINDVILSLSADRTLISNNLSSTLTATLNWGTYSEILNDIPVHFNDEVVLTTKGVATYSIDGDGSGNKTVTASVYGSSETVEIEDVYQYWSKKNGSLSISYRDRYGSTTSQSNGWKCTPNSSGRYMSQLMNFEDNNITWEFIVKGVSKLTGIGQDNNPISGIKVGDVIQAVYDVETNYVTYMVNQTTIGSFQHHGSIISFDFYFADSSGYLTIDEFKIKGSA